MLKIQEALDLIIEHYIDELREARRGERHTIPDRYALTILEDTEAIRNYVKPVLADRIRELDEQVPKIRIEDLTGEISGKEGKIPSNWNTETPIEEGDYLLVIKAPKGVPHYFPNFLNSEGKWRYVYRGNIIAWQKIEPYKEKEYGKCSH